MIEVVRQNGLALRYADPKLIAKSTKLVKEAVNENYLAL